MAGTIIKTLRTLALAAAGLSTLFGCKALEGAFDPIALPAPFRSKEDAEIRYLPIALKVSDPNVNRVGKLEYRGGLYLWSDDKRFGGLSGLMISPDGKRLLAVSDEAFWLTAELSYKDGRLSGVSRARIAPMLDMKGQPMSGKQGDAEALTAAGSEGMAGPVYVAFERSHRVWRYDFGKDGFNAIPTEVPLPADSKKMTSNGGIEGLIALDDRTLFAMAEDARDRKYDLQGWLVPRPDAQKPGGESVVFLKAVQDFKPTDLAALPRGDIYLLERSFSLERGAAMQIRRIKRANVGPLSAFGGEVIAHMDVRYSIDNMEGLALRRGERGETLLYIVSDDNYNGLQRTVLLQFALAAGQ